MQISTIKNRNFGKPSMNPSNRTKVNFQTKFFLDISVTAKMFELRNSGENRRIRSEFFFENLPRIYKDLIQVKKIFKIISCLCTFKYLTNSVHDTLFLYSYCSCCIRNSTDCPLYCYCYCKLFFLIVGFKNLKICQKFTKIQYLQYK